MRKILALLLLCVAFASCREEAAPAPAPSLSGVWQIFGKDKPDLLEIADEGGTLTGFYKPSDDFSYDIDGTRIGTKFDLHASQFTQGKREKDIFNFTGTLDEPHKISGTLTARDGIAHLWRAQYNIATIPNFAEFVQKYRADMAETWAKAAQQAPPNPNAAPPSR